MRKFYSILIMILFAQSLMTPGQEFGFSIYNGSVPNSRLSIITEKIDKDLILMYSNELQVRDDTPPTFFVHADNYVDIPDENSLLIYKALIKKRIPDELLL